MREFPTIDPKERDIEWSWQEKDYNSSLCLNDNLDKSKTLEITNLNRVNENTLFYLFLKKFFDEVDTGYKPEETFDVYHAIEKREKNNPNRARLLAIRQESKLYIIDLQKSLE